MLEDFWEKIIYFPLNVIGFCFQLLLQCIRIPINVEMFEFCNLSLDWLLEWGDVNKRWQVLAGYPCYPVEIGGIGQRGKWTFIAPWTNIKTPPAESIWTLLPSCIFNTFILNARIANNWSWSVNMHWWRKTGLCNWKSGCFFLTKKLKYGKPRFGESTLT